jgi:hypothetical protein
MAPQARWGSKTSPTAPSVPRNREIPEILKPVRCGAQYASKKISKIQDPVVPRDRPKHTMGRATALYAISLGLLLVVGHRNTDQPGEMQTGIPTKKGC